MKSGLIVEDLPDTLAWLSQLLPNAFPDMAIYQARNLAEAHQQIDLHQPELALIDLGLPDGSGIELIERLHRESPNTLCVVSTIFDDDQHLLPALKAGAQGYILKDRDSDEVAQLLEGIRTGRPPLSAAIARRLISFFGPSETTQNSPLTQREHDVLALIAKGYTVKKAGELLGISRNTCAGYVKDIYRKLQISSRAEATVEASRLGLLSPHTN
ncbi:response regulator, NarL-family [gamma proteobacterium HTCC5015]|nr:response regulator, NarL-family [gamma proteobacterium HTCC5015]